MTSPVSTNSGTAISANESTLSNSASPNSESGSASVDSSSTTVPRPMTTQNGTASASSTSMKMTERPDSIGAFWLGGRSHVEQQLAREGLAPRPKIAHVPHDRLQQPDEHQRKSDRHCQFEPGFGNPQRGCLGIELE